MNHPVLSPLYDELWSKAIHSFQHKDYSIDPFLANKHTDSRRGLSLICRPSLPVRNMIKRFLIQIGELTEQYFYELEELHTTVLTLISCDPQVSLETIKQDDYISCIQKALQTQHTFSLTYQGISASSSAIMVQGFPLDEGLEDIRNNLRAAFRKTSLYHTIDKRYRLITAHCTIIRFLSIPEVSDRFLTFLQAQREQVFGTCLISELELVYTDWYFSHEVVQTLHRFPLDRPIS